MHIHERLAFDMKKLWGALETSGIARPSEFMGTHDFVRVQGSDIYEH
jgi:hypothetical protein